MGWQLSARSVELCSCKMLCPCWLGPEGTPDEGWRGGTLGFDIQRGNSDGIDLDGPSSLSRRNGQGISLAARERLVCTSATVQMPSSVARWRRYFRGKRAACLKDCGAP